MESEIVLQNLETSCENCSCFVECICKIEKYLLH